MRGKRVQPIIIPDFMSGLRQMTADDYTKENPCLIAEVLSDSTRATDQREKREAYLAMPSLQTSTH